MNTDALNQIFLSVFIGALSVAKNSRFIFE